MMLRIISLVILALIEVAAAPVGLGWLPGVATRQNLQSMLANPADLAAPAPLAPASGDASIAAARRLRLGQALPLPGSSTGSDPAQQAEPAAAATTPLGGQ